MMNDIECPYCGAEQEICHDDGQGYAEDELHQTECSKCDRVFVFRTTIHFYYKADKADCLNGGEHTYEPTHTFPKIATRMQCTQCEEERQPTKEEWQEILK